MFRRVKNPVILMPDNNYVWVVMQEDCSLPIAVFQKRYDLVSFMTNNLELAGLFTIVRFPPYGGEWKFIDNNTLRAVKNG